MRESLSRRALLRLSLATGAVAAVSRSAWAAPASGGPAATTRLDPKDPAAIKLAYVEDAARLDPKAQPKFITGSNCENCLLLQGKPGDEYRPCTLFPGKLVKISGWCTGWAAEM
jgi:hypothetical protein